MFDENYDYDFSNDSFIPGAESWLFEDPAEINASIDINSDEEADEADSNALAQSAENEQQGAELDRDDQKLTMMMYQGFAGYESLFRMREYMNRGGNERTVEMLYDVQAYLPQEFIYSSEALNEKVDKASGGFKDFLARIWRALVALFQRMLPFLGQNLNTLETRVSAYEQKLRNISNDTGNAKLKSYKKDKKVISPVGTGPLAAILTWLTGGIWRNKRNFNRRKTLERNYPVNKYSVSDINNVLASIKRGLAQLKKEKSELDKRIADAKEKLHKIETTAINPKEIKKEREKATNDKQEATNGLDAIRTATSQYTQALNDVKFLIGVAS